LLNDVISMDVAILVTALPNRIGNPQPPAQPAFMDLFDPRLYAPPIYAAGQPHPRNPGYFDPTVPANRLRPAVFDTWSSLRNDLFDYSQWAGVGGATSVPMVFNTDNRLVAIKITIRVWDQKSQQARQVTIIQDM
jgi:hypothetical protein